MAIKKLFSVLLLSLALSAAGTLSAQKLSVINQAEVTSLAHMKADSGQTIVVNFWATWCGPCVRELPYFIQADTSLKGENFKFVFVSFDPLSNESKVQKFITKNGMPGTHYIIGSFEMESLIEQVHPKWEGGIPFTLAITHKETRYHEGAFENFRQFWQFIRD